jgi:seryl-tRNA synthetase
MLDIKLIRENPEIVENDLQKRKDTEKIRMLHQLIKNDKERRDIISKLDALRQQRNAAAVEISTMKKQRQDASDKLDEMTKISTDIKNMEQRFDDIEIKCRFALMRLPNILHETVPVGKDDSENSTVRTWGNTEKKNFELKGHEELGMALGCLDIERAAKISGARFFFLTGKLAILEMSIMRCAIDLLVSRGYELVLPPLMMKKEPYEGVVDLADFQDVLYKIEGEDLHMIATSEHPLTARYMNDTLLGDSLPIKNIGFSTNFRKEAGTHGKDTKGFFRTHQFNKVEQIVISKPEDSWRIHEELIKNAEDFFKLLEVPYRVVNICTGDIGTVAAKKYDLEAWMPHQQKYREMVSCSNCTDYQARRLNLRYRDKMGESSRGCVHTLNSTAVTDRALVAIIENHQQADGSIRIPKALQTYTGFSEITRK